MLFIVCLVIGAGAAAIAVGLAQSRHPALDPADYLRDLDRDGEIDEFITAYLRYKAEKEHKRAAK